MSATTNDYEPPKQPSSRSSRDREVSERRSTSKPRRTASAQGQSEGEGGHPQEKKFPVPRERQGQEVKNGSKTLDVPEERLTKWGTINLAAPDFERFWSSEYSNRPRDFEIPAINPKLLWKLGRDSRMEFLEALSKHQITIVVINDGSDIDGEKKKKQKQKKKPKGKQVDYATMMILALSIRILRQEDHKIVGELAGLSPPSVMASLGQFSWLPVLQLEDIQPLAHAATRSICHEHYTSDGRVVLSGTVGRAVGGLIASILSSTDENRSVDFQVPTIFEDIFASDVKDRDKGAEVGLVFAGMMKYIKNSADGIERKTKIITAVVDSVLAGLTAVPGGGVAFAIVQPGIDYFLESKRDEKLGEITGMLVSVQNWYNDHILAPLHRDGGKLVIHGNSVHIDKGVFNEWYGVVMAFNGL